MNSIPQVQNHKKREVKLAAIVGIFILIGIKQVDGSGSLQNISKVINKDSTLNKESFDSIVEQHQILGQIIHEEKKIIGNSVRK